MIQWFTDLRWVIWGYRFHRARGLGRRAAWAAGKRTVGGP